ncbi:MAG TPA: hypothetical protein PLJ51_11025 [Limnochordia bacterium]|nr:hypothetical protein [Limnochordia bacterium]
MSYIKHAMEQEQEEYVWELWSNAYPLMATGLVPFKPYGDFRREILKPRIKYSNKSSEEVMKEMLAVVEAYEKGR